MQNQWDLINGEWYITNYTTDDFELLESDTLILHRKEWRNIRKTYRDSIFNSSGRWNFQFEDFGGFEISWCDFVRMSRGSQPPFCTPMYPCQNLVWQMFKKTIKLYIDGIPYTFDVHKVNSNKNELMLIKSP